MNLVWYARRLARMSPAEVALRTRDEVRQRSWRRHRGHDVPAVPVRTPSFASGLVGPTTSGVSDRARAHLITAADDLLDGRWDVFARRRHDMMPAPDWFLDPRTGRRAPSSTYCFDIDHRDEGAVGNVKYVWETSRHHHVTVLAAAWHLTRDERYADAVAGQLTSWWCCNPFLSGIHWTSGIEIGIRLVSWVWTRRLLDGWAGVGTLFERNPVFLRQLYDHQRFIAAFPSRGTSANNHVIAELAGQFAAACAFPWFKESASWRADAAAGLAHEIPGQTFADGLNRELATAYHGLVLELGLVAAIEGEVSAHPLDDVVWSTLRAMCDALAGIVDVESRPPRQGDDDGGHGLLLDAPTYDRWTSLLATGAALFGAAAWWPRVSFDADVRTALWTAHVHSVPAVGRHDRPAEHPALFGDAGMVIIRDRADARDELWCRLDHGPHGFLAIAAHAHADALSIEVRVGGVDVLADPGTYCYHGDPEWRSWFRSTRGHNTLEVAGVDQSVPGGPFLWSRHAKTTLERAEGLRSGPVAEWQAAHDGYRRLRPSVTHRRNVRLDRVGRRLEITDALEGRAAADHLCRLSFHLGPDIRCDLHDGVAELHWPTLDGATGRATLELPHVLDWSAVRGRDEPPTGWYSPAFDVRVPTTTLVGTGRIAAGGPAQTTLTVGDDHASTRLPRPSLTATSTSDPTRAKDHS